MMQSCGGLRVIHSGAGDQFVALLHKLHSAILACMKRGDFCERVSEYFVHEIKDSKVEEHNQFLK